MVTRYKPRRRSGANRTGQRRITNFFGRSARQLLLPGPFLVPMHTPFFAAFMFVDLGFATFFE
jgi:hypothetical protein